MIIRAFLPAAAMALGSAGAVLADVDVKVPGVHIRAPSGPVDIGVEIDSKIAPSQTWVGRSVYSIDGKHIGEVAAVANDNIYVDMGAFLGLGESRVLLRRAEIGSVTDDRIVLKLTEDDAKVLPRTDAKPIAPKERP